MLPRPIKDCTPDGHIWVFQDDSFEHEFGCERVHYFRCERCGAERPAEDEDFQDSGWLADDPLA